MNSPFQVARATAEANPDLAQESFEKSTGKFTTGRFSGI